MLQRHGLLVAVVPGKVWGARVRGFEEGVGEVQGRQLRRHESAAVGAAGQVDDVDVHASI